MLFCRVKIHGYFHICQLGKRTSLVLAKFTSKAGVRAFLSVTQDREVLELAKFSTQTGVYLALVSNLGLYLASFSKFFVTISFNRGSI